MKRKTNDASFGPWFGRSISFFMVVGLGLALATAAAAQKDKKKKSDTAPQQTPGVTIPLQEQQKIDYVISEMLGAWQVGDIEKLHKDVADDVSVVNGQWAPPVMGWDNYLASYKMQRARAQQVRLDRSNTLIRIAGNVAWASYQWDFSAIVDGQPSAAQGQTTLILEKRSENWVVVHNHTSLVQASQPTVPATPTPQPATAPKP
jgi:ketosteroid isomerase-like protein